jgi:hypothetical protein
LVTRASLLPTTRGLTAVWLGCVRQVRQLVEQHGLRKWALIAAALNGKTQKQVYARWRDYLQVRERVTGLR